MLNPNDYKIEETKYGNSMCLKHVLMLRCHLRNYENCFWLMGAWSVIDLLLLIAAWVLSFSNFFLSVCIFSFLHVIWFVVVVGLYFIHCVGVSVVFANYFIYS